MKRLISTSIYNPNRPLRGPEGRSEFAGNYANKMEVTMKTEKRLTLEDIQRASKYQTNKPWGFLGHYCRDKGRRCDRIFLEACNDLGLDYSEMVLMGESRSGRHLGDFLDSHRKQTDKQLIAHTAEWIDESLKEMIDPDGEIGTEESNSQ